MRQKPITGTAADPTSIQAQGAEFLELLETKHNQVLTELDALNARIEQVLKLYASSRDTSSGHSGSSDQAAASFRNVA